jgi:hypothetical protein
MVRIPKGIYANIASQTQDDGSFVLVEYWLNTTIRDMTLPTDCITFPRIHFHQIVLTRRPYPVYPLVA